MNIQLTEDHLVEQPAINWFKEVGYSYIHGSELSSENQERESYRDVILKKRFIPAIKKLNSWLTDSLAEEVYKKVTELDHPDFIIKSKMFYEMLTNGVKLTFKEKEEEKTRLVKLIDFDVLSNNEFLIANQFTVEYQYLKDEYRRPDLVVFINGMPLAIFEFKSFNADETAKDAFCDHRTKMQDIPQLFVYAQILGVSDGLETKYGSISSDWDRFFVWEGILSDDDLEIKEIENELEPSYAHKYYISKATNQRLTSLEVLIKGLFRREHLLEYLGDFIVYDKSKETYIKKIAMYHQFYSVRKAIERTKRAVLEAKTPEDRRIGIIWHTQGSGKSLTMLFYARKLLKVKELENPLLLFITDRRDLDDQLSGVFKNILAVAEQIGSIKDLQETLRKNIGGVIFATIQKFGKRKNEEYPFLTDRRNIIVIADEAHRSQYRELAQNLRKALPCASFMGFTATPIDLQDRSTTLVFGDYISIYSMERARRHNVVVPIYYEARLSEEHLSNEFIDEEFDEISESVKPELREDLKKRFARLERLILAEDRLKKVAKDIVEHFNRRNEEYKGKAMIVTISRKVAVKLYEEIIKQPNAPSVVVVISGDRTKEPEYAPHIRNRYQLEDLADNFKNPQTEPQLAIVVDMWLTGFDIPCLHTMYFDKPMKNHSLVQAIARVNRVFKDKPGGLIIDYIGIADDLRKSLSLYTLDTIRDIFLDIEEVLNQLKEKYDIVKSYFCGVDYQEWKNYSPEELSKLTTLVYDKICADEEVKKKFIRNFIALKKLYALASPHPETYKIKDDLRFFEMIKKMIVKYSTAKVKDISRDLEYEISHLISKSISAEEPIDIFTLMGKERPDISIFDEKFLAEFKNMQYKNYTAQLLAKIIKDDLIVRMKKNPYRYRSFYEMLKNLIDKYNVKLLDTVEIIEKLVELAKEIKKAVDEGKKLNLSDSELAFYDLLLSKEKFFQNYEEIEKVAKEVAKEMGYYIKVADWNKKEYVKAKIKAAVKKILIRIIDGRVSYNEIEQLSKELINHLETIYT
ncbi:MAG: restriction endonuclease subunit R [Candidatus Omnitrophota bacterium]|nr:MAG: restriction endonuclease subunit R [Candidatus Omnitrophota bacterium]